MKKDNIIKHIWKLVKENALFLIVIVSTLLALTLIVILTFGSFYKGAREDAVTIGSMTVSQEAKRIEDSLSAGINTLLVSSYTADNMLSNNSTPKEIEDYLVQETNGIITGIDENFKGLYGVIQDVYVDGTGWLPEEEYDPYSRPWYLAAKEKNGDLAIVSPYIDAQTGDVLISFSKMLSDKKSVISFDVRLDNIYEVTEKIQLEGKGYCFLVDFKGQIIAHRDHEEVGKNYLSDPEFVDTDIRSLMEKIISSDPDETLQDINLNDNNCMVFTSIVQEEWYVVLVVNSNDLFADIHASLFRNIFISLLIFILVGYFCTSNYKNRKKAIKYAENIRIDDLTGLNNRGEFDRYLHDAFKNITNDSNLYLMMFDADGFKGINDEYGHQEGDNALRIIAKAIKEQCHNTDWFCARYGGDEFVIICKVDNENIVIDIQNGINQKLKTAVEENKLKYTLSLSCGYAHYDLSINSLNALVDLADSNLYKMKKNKQ